MTVATIRTGYLNRFLDREEAETEPWSDDDCNQAIDQAIDELWPEFGAFASATVATDQTTPVYTIPSPIERVSRITLERTDSGNTSVISNVVNWRVHSDTEVIISPLIATDAALVLRFYGYTHYANDASDLPDRLESLVAMKAASICYGIALGRLTNFENQQALDSGKQFTYSDAVGLSAYWQRRYEERVRIEPDRPSYAPLAAYR